MSQSVGWIKLHRNIRYSFSHDRKLNRDLYDLYVYLASEASYQDGLLQTKGQIITTSTKLQRDWFHDWYVKKIQRYLKRLHDDKWIILSKATQRDQDGYCIEICSFDTISGKIKRTVEKDSCFDSVLTKSSQCPHGVLTVSAECPHDEVFLYREEEKEEEGEEEELNTVVVADAPTATQSISIINNEPSKKIKKPRQEVDHREALDTFYQGYEQRYGVKPLINAKVIRHLKDLVKRCGKDAPRLISFYLSHNNSFYLSKAHQIEFALKDCEKLYTEMHKNDYIFNKDAKKVEEATANSILLEQLLAKNRKEGHDDYQR